MTTTSMCIFPGCDRPAAATGATTGRPGGFCDLAGHNAGTAYRARKAEPVVPVGDPDQPVTAAGTRAGSLRGELVKLATDLATRLTEVSAEFEAMADPEKATVEIEAIELRAAEALAAERSARASAQAGERSAVDGRIKARAERDEARAAADQFEAELASANAVHDEDVQALVAVRDDLALAVDDVAVLDADLTGAKAERDVERERASGLEVELTGARSEAAAASTLATRLQAQLEAVTARVDEVTARVAVADTARVEADRARVNAETTAARLEAQLAATQGRVVDLQQERAELTATTLAATDRAARAEARVEAASKAAAEAATDRAKSGQRPGPSD